MSKTLKKSLPKFTDSEKKIAALLNKKKISNSDLDTLSPEEHNYFVSTINKQMNELKGEGFDILYGKIEEITTTDTKNQIWERNHNKITYSISTLMQEYGRMPTISEIADKAELSRQSVHKHMKTYAVDDRYLEIKEQFQFMAEKVLARVFKFAVNGDIRAAKLYFEVMGRIGAQPTGSVQNTHNNYIQINQIKINQDTIRQLSSEQLNQIEAVLKNLLPVAA